MHRVWREWDAVRAVPPQLLLRQGAPAEALAAAPPGLRRRGGPRGPPGGLKEHPRRHRHHQGAAHAPIPWPEPAVQSSYLAQVLRLRCHSDIMLTKKISTMSLECKEFCANILWSRFSFVI